MTVVLDTSFLFALTDLTDRNHDRVDFVDAVIVAIAERLGITHVLTLDRRDFSIMRPRHCGYFEILP